MGLGRLFVRALFFTGLAVPVFAADVAPLHFDGIDGSKQQAYWDNLIKFKIWGTNGIEMGRAKLPDESGWTGTARGGFKGTNNQIVLGGPVIIGGDISLGNEDKFTTGPIRTTGAFYAGANNGSGNYFASTSCVDGSVNDLTKGGINHAGGSLRQGANAHTGICDAVYVAEVKTDMKVPELKSAVTYSGSVNINDRSTGYLDVPSGSGVYDVYLESFRMGSSSTLYVRIPNEGRIVRIFVRDGLNLSDHPTIQIMNVGTDAKYDASKKSYTSVGMGARVIKNNEYAGNLLFYTTKDITFANTDNHPVQGSFITTGTIRMVSNMVFAGQLIANKMEIGNEIDGKDFIYVPFDPPEIDIEGLVRDARFVENDKLVEVPVHLTKVPETDVFIEFCYVDGTYGGLSLKESADESDLLNVEGDMPYCQIQVKGDERTYTGKTRKITIPAGSLVAKDDDKKPWIRVKDDGIVESHEERIIFYVTKISGAVIKGNATAGGVYLTLIDKQNNPPKFDDSDPNLNVDENVLGADIGYINGVIRASDAENDDLLFEIVGGNGKDFFDIEKVKGKNEAKVSLKKDVSFDYEALSEIGFAYDITVKVYEFEGAGSDTKTFKVKVNDVNENPIVHDTTVHVRENIDEKSATPRIQWSDIDVYNVSFRDNEIHAVDGDVDVFDVQANGRLILQPGATLDYDTKSEYTLKVKVVDKGNADLYDEATVTIIVDDVDDSPYFVGDLDGSVLENSSKGTLVNTVVGATSNKNRTLSYSLDDPTGTFTINSKTGEVTVAANNVLDYEKQSSYVVTITVSDDSKSVQKATEKATITVIDVNENPIFEGGSADFAENLPVGSSITKLEADDLDMDPQFRNNIFVFADGDVDGFELDPLTGVIKTTKIFDYEADEKVYTLKVTVRDVNDEKIAVTKNVVLNLTNENEAPNIVETKFTVEENAEGGTVVGKLDGFDPDGDTDLTFVLFEGDVPFSVKPDGEIVVKEGSSIDFETKDSYEFIVRVIDGGELHTDSVITVKVIDVNEAPKVDNQRFVVEENVDAPFQIGFIDVNDPDTDPSMNNVTCKLVDESEIFSVDVNCSLTLNKPLDYETDSLYKITVVGTDGELSDTAEVTIVVKDVYEATEVEITRAENKDSVWINPDTIYVHLKEIALEWKVDGELNSGDTTLSEGMNVVIKEVCDAHKNECGRDTLVVYVSTAAPIVTVSADKKEFKADDFYTIVEDVDEKDSSIYVNTTKNEIMVTVKDTASRVSESFTVNVELDEASVPSSMLKTISSIADAKVSLDSKAEAKQIPENDDRIKVTYKDRVNGKDVFVTYYTDRDGETLKTPVVVDGKVKDVKTITVSYTETVGGKDVTVSYLADASTGKRVDLPSGYAGGDSKSAGDFLVSYDYEDKAHHAVSVSYLINEKGDVICNGEGNTGFQVSYTYKNKFGNSAKRSIFVVLDQVMPKVEILTPAEDDVIYGSFTEVEWKINGKTQDTLNVQSLDNGLCDIIRTYIDKAGNVSTAKVTVVVKKAKDVEISVEKPVTIIDADSVQKYYDKHSPKEGDLYVVSVFNAKHDREEEVLIGGKDGERDGKGKEPYEGLDGHLGPTLDITLHLPGVSNVTGLATLDDIVGKDGLVAIDGVDAVDSRKVSVDEYVRDYCTDEFADHRGSDNSKMNLYDINVDVDVWVYTSLGSYVDRFTFNHKMNNPDYVDGAGHAKMNFEMKPDLNGNVRTSDGRLVGTGAYIYKTDVSMQSKLRCVLPPVGDKKKPSGKKDEVLKSSDELLKPFGLKRPKKML